MLPNLFFKQRCKENKFNGQFTYCKCVSVMQQRPNMLNNYNKTLLFLIFTPWSFWLNDDVRIRNPGCRWRLILMKSICICRPVVLLHLHYASSYCLVWPCCLRSLQMTQRPHLPPALASLSSNSLLCSKCNLHLASGLIKNTRPLIVENVLSLGLIKD